MCIEVADEGSVFFTSVDRAMHASSAVVSAADLEPLTGELGCVTGFTVFLPPLCTKYLKW
jgi:hypothetical protein